MCCCHLLLSPFCKFFLILICYVLVFVLPKDSLVKDKKAVLQLRCQQAFTRDDRQSSILLNIRWRRARHERRRPGWKLGSLCQVPTTWEVLRSVRMGHCNPNPHMYTVFNKAKLRERFKLWLLFFHLLKIKSGGNNVTGVSSAHKHTQHKFKWMERILYSWSDKIIIRH